MKYSILLIFTFLHVFEYSAACQNQELPIVIKSAPKSSSPMVFYISGDGGWNSYDKKLAAEYELNKMPYIALNSFHYFWTRKTPNQLVNDVIPVIQKYLKEWNKNEIIFVGYSFGAEIVPFLITRLPNDLKNKVKLVTLITPGSTSDFTIHVNDMLLLDGTYDYKVVPEISKISNPEVLCFFGADETSIFPKSHVQKNLKVVSVKGGHVFSDSKIVMDGILNELKLK